MKKSTLTLQWKGTFIELCMGRVTESQMAQIGFHDWPLAGDLAGRWYDNTDLLKSLFDVDNWWSIDDLDHAMGLLFSDRAALDRQLPTIAFAIDRRPATVDPDALQLSFYLPETPPALNRDERIVWHGAQREAVLHLEAEFTPPFDPSLVTLSFLDYPDAGLILIDADYDGHDDIHFTWGQTRYLEPRFLGKEHFDDPSR